MACIEQTLGQSNQRSVNLEEIESETEHIVLDGQVLVCGIHNRAHQRAAVVPLRWGAPRIICLSGGFLYHLGEDLNQELFPVARLWRYQFDPETDLVISRRAPAKRPTYASFNPTVDRMIKSIVEGTWPGLSSPCDSLTAPVRIAS